MVLFNIIVPNKEATTERLPVALSIVVDFMSVKLPNKNILYPLNCSRNI